MTIKRYIGVIIILAVAAPIYAQDPKLQNVDEQKLIAILKSNAPLYDKTQACQKLAGIGSEKSVPLLAGLLGDKTLGDYARIAMEPMKHADVDEAFRTAAGKLKGRLLAGVITSIGARRDAKAVSALQKLISDEDRNVARAALYALGRIANDKATGAILQTLSKGPDTLKTPAADAALSAARTMLDAGKTDSATVLYDAVAKAAVPTYVRTSAVYGAILARGPASLPLLVKHLKSNDPALIAVALRAARELPGDKVSRKLAEELPQALAAVQVMLIKALVDRRDPIACKAIASLTVSKTPAVRFESLRALGIIGQADSVAFLLAAAGAKGRDSTVALASLRSITGKGVGAAILEGMTKANVDLKANLISVLSDRRYAPAARPIVALAGSNHKAVAWAAFKAIGVLGTPADIREILKTMSADSPQAEASIVALAAKIADPSKRADPVLAALAQEKNPDRQAALVRILGRIGGDKALDAVVKSDNKDAAVRALAGWPDAKAAGPLLGIVKNTQNRTHHILALRGYIRLLGLDPNTPVNKYAEALTLAKQPDTKKLVLSGIASVAHIDALRLVIRLLDDKTVQGEAALAAVSIAKATMGSDRQTVLAAMKKVLAASKGKPAAREARRIISQIEKKVSPVSDKEFFSTREQASSGLVDKGFFNGKDLAGWLGSELYWKVEDGAIVGNNEKKLTRNLFIWSSVLVKDFYLVVDVKVEPWNRNAGIQFRSRKISEFGAHGYQADAGGGFWGRLFHEHGRKHLDNKGFGFKASKKDDWNRYEILAVGDCIWASVNGALSISIKDPKGEKSGYIAFQVHAGKPQTARYKIIRLVHNPETKLDGYTEKQLRAALRDPLN
jgi:HEAT repeat protein